MTIALTPETTYRLVADVKVGRCDFPKGSTVTFSSGGYSPYDDCYIYHFVDSAGQKFMCASQSSLTDSDLAKFVAPL